MTITGGLVPVRSRVQWLATRLHNIEERIGRVGLLALIGVVAVVVSVLVSWIVVGFASGADAPFSDWPATVIPLVTAGTCAPLMGWFFLSLLDDVRQLSEGYRYLAEHDQLTGLVNRHGLFARLGEFPPGSTIVLCDIDRFKEVNDEFGHLVGDQLLETTARLLRDSCPQGTLLARIGGDEFLLLLTPAQRAELGALPVLRVSTAQVSANLAVGAAVFDGDFDAALATADAAMYVAKTRGRRSAR